MRSLVLAALLAAAVAVLLSGTQTAEYLRGLTFIALVALYVVIGWPAYRAHREHN
jgi:membrane protein implicated in regulation of membrane protease activity